MNRYSISEILEMAVQTEKLGNQFYTEMADRFQSNQELVRLFNTLAAKERIHEKTFTSLKEMAAAGAPKPTNWEDVADYMRAFVESEFFIGKGKALPSMDKIKSAKDAVNFALGFEKETLLYFMELRNIVKEKEMVDEVINEEKSHIMWLDRFRTSLAK